MTYVLLALTPIVDKSLYTGIGYLFIYTILMLIVINIGGVVVKAMFKPYLHLKRRYLHYKFYKKYEIIITKIKWADPIYTDEKFDSLKVEKIHKPNLKHKDYKVEKPLKQIEKELREFHSYYDYLISEYSFESDSSSSDEV
jgi:hypothetical protein